MGILHHDYGLAFHLMFGWFITSTGPKFPGKWRRVQVFSLPILGSSHFRLQLSNWNSSWDQMRASKGAGPANCWGWGCGYWYDNFLCFRLTNGTPRRLTSTFVWLHMVHQSHFTHLWNSCETTLFGIWNGMYVSPYLVVNDLSRPAIQPIKDLVSSSPSSWYRKGKSFYSSQVGED